MDSPCKTLTLALFSPSFHGSRNHANIIFFYSDPGICIHHRHHPVFSTGCWVSVQQWGTPRPSSSGPTPYAPATTILPLPCRPTNCATTLRSSTSIAPAKFLRND